MKELRLIELVHQVLVSQYVAGLKSSEIRRATLQTPDASGEERTFLLITNFKKWFNFVGKEIRN